jgi:hypothetical protein
MKDLIVACCSNSPAEEGYNFYEERKLQLVPEVFTHFKTRSHSY